MNSGPAIGAMTITPNDNTDISICRGIYIGGSGDLRVKMLDGTIVVFTSIAAGMVHPLSISRVYATGTTATGIVAVY